MGEGVSSSESREVKGGEGCARRASSKRSARSGSSSAPRPGAVPARARCARSACWPRWRPAGRPPPPTLAASSSSEGTPAGPRRCRPPASSRTSPRRTRAPAGLEGCKGCRGVVVGVRRGRGAQLCARHGAGSGALAAGWQATRTRAKRWWAQLRAAGVATPNQLPKEGACLDEGGQHRRVVDQVAKQRRRRRLLPAHDEKVREAELARPQRLLRARRREAGERAAGGGGAHIRRPVVSPRRLGRAVD